MRLAQRLIVGRVMVQFWDAKLQRFKERKITLLDGRKTAANADIARDGEITIFYRINK